jgi:hypothetical protein
VSLRPPICGHPVVIRIHINDNEKMKSPGVSFYGLKCTKTHVCSFKKEGGEGRGGRRWKGGGENRGMEEGLDPRSTSQLRPCCDGKPQARFLVNNKKRAFYSEINICLHDSDTFNEECFVVNFCFMIFIVSIVRKKSELTSQFNRRTSIQTHSS